MNWHETIEYIQEKPEYSKLVIDAYLDKNLELNFERFYNSEEYNETKILLKKYAPNAKLILDVGAGNGISTISFATDGYEVTALEPDISELVGTKAIEILSQNKNLQNINILNCYAESTEFLDNSFDVIYVRQALHHANNLQKFVSEMYRILKPNGILFTLRDHVILDEKDKSDFLKTHPLNKFYNGENAFTLEEYKSAFIKSKFKISEEFSFYSSVLNYAPLTKNDLSKKIITNINNYKEIFKKTHPFISLLPFSFKIFKLKNGINNSLQILNEKQISGRLYSFILKK